MSTGVFGSIRPANIDIENDVEIFYFYRPSRGENDDNFNGFKKLDAQSCLTKSCENDSETAIQGMFNLKLPLDKFNKKGFYTIYIRPKEREVQITDVSVLATYPDIKGVVFNPKKISGISDLTGYRMEFDDGTVRLIKSCNLCEPVIVNTGDGYPKTTRYNLSDGGNLFFCTVSPSSAPSFKTNALPYIGEPGLSIKLVNTKFTPQMIELEMVDHDADTLSYMIEGDQTNDRDNAIITTYNDKNEIYHQSDYYVLKDKLGNPLYNIKRKRENIDHSQDYDNIMD